MITILKFFENKNSSPRESNDVISRTLSKISVINRNYKPSDGVFPKHGELWKCRIVKEKEPGKAKGCFLVDPISKLDKDDVKYVIPGLYDERLVNGKLLVYPKRMGPENNWIMPLMLKELIFDKEKAYSLIVVLDESSEIICDK